MSTPVEAGAEPEMPERSARRRGGRRLLVDVVVVLAAFLVAAVVVGALWPHLVHPVEVVRDKAGLLTDETALAERFGNVGWYTLLAGGAGVLLGAVLTAWRRTDELVTLVAVIAAACLAAWLSAKIGTWLGPDDPKQVLAAAKVGATAPDRVVLDAQVAYLVWPISALIGASVVLWSRPGRR
jgi:hypothetical protein